ncbi:segregation and condensation protein A [Tengunoibacter tsumagoiensis]|uniref:Segregation and condensation protein A n=1 Tax=Tengunoibacter tsumagoiensis TaxID=2014871 RepID=A0A401ZUD0_9CHLR|nr:segregation/condensation protein A [Tengunoibacter tsumagoiensis]GCE10396.1 segregation/condensation protein A [Tengunoibacter tsumagoiensis]
MLEPLIPAASITEEPAQQARYIVHLPVFEGPLDLLLHLIEKRQMEITLISLMEVTDQYVAYLQGLEDGQMPLANMASFVSIAARLLFIKSQSLLPQAPRAEENEEMNTAVEMAEELQRHLIEYKLTKEIAHVLRKHEESGLQTHARSGLLAGIEAQLAWTPPTLVGMEASSLARAFQRLLELQTKENVAGTELMPTRKVRVSECIAAIRLHLQSRSSVLLSEILADESSRIVIIVTFIAVLEMWKWQRIEVSQEDPMGPLMLERGPLWNETGLEEELS